MCVFCIKKFLFFYKKKFVFFIDGPSGAPYVFLFVVGCGKSAIASTLALTGLTVDGLPWPTIWPKYVTWPQPNSLLTKFIANLASLNRFVKTFVKFPDALPTINDHVINNITFATVDLGNYPVDKALEGGRGIPHSKWHHIVLI